MRSNTPSTIPRKGILVAITLVVLVGILVLGLAPYNPLGPDGVHFPDGDAAFHFHILYPNDVRWLKGENGLEFGSHGSIFSIGDFQPAHSRSSSGCTLEIALQPAAVDGPHSILFFSTPQNFFQLRVSQEGDGLFISRDIPSQTGTMNTVLLTVDHVFQLDQPLLITIASGEKATTVYRNGALVKTSSTLLFTTNEFSGRLVIGNSPASNNPWGGRLRGLAFFAHEFNSQEAAERYKTWASNGSLQQGNGSGLLALYPFSERAGSIVHNVAGGEPDLSIPERFKILHQPLFVSPWREYEGSMGYFYFRDVLLNILGFMPLGLLVCACFFSLHLMRRPALAATILGAMVSLTIEILQSYLPLRHSGVTDLFTNTSGTAIGALLFYWAPLRRVFEKVGLIAEE